MSAAEEMTGKVIDLMQALKDSLAECEPEKEAPVLPDVQEERVAPGVGVYPDLSWDDYHAVDAASCSRLTLLRRSPLHMIEEVRNPPEPTRAMIFGSAFHALVLEPGSFRDRYALAGRCAAITGKGSQCTNGGSVIRDGEWFCGVRGHDPRPGEPGDSLIVLTDEEWTDLHNMRAALMAHPDAGPAIEETLDRELSAFWTDPETGVLCKARWDAPNAERGVILDLKSCDDASPGGFRRSLGRWGHHRQHAHYFDGAGIVAPETFAHFLFVVVEKKRPYGVVIYELPDAAVQQGREELRALLDVYARCLQTETWPGYAPGVHYLDIPQYAYWAEGPLTGEE